MMDPLIKWNQTVNPLYPTCITGYLVADQGNPSLTTNVTSNVTSLTSQQLNAAGFPYCISIHPTVTPLTPMGPLTPVMGISNLYTNLIDPGRLYITVIDSTIKILSDFPTPMLTFKFPPLNQSENETGIVVLRIYVQVSKLITFFLFGFTTKHFFRHSQSLRYPLVTIATPISLVHCLP